MALSDEERRVLELAWSWSFVKRDAQGKIAEVLAVPRCDLDFRRNDVFARQVLRRRVQLRAESQAQEANTLLDVVERALALDPYVRPVVEATCHAACARDGARQRGAFELVMQLRKSRRSQLSSAEEDDLAKMLLEASFSPQSAKSSHLGLDDVASKEGVAGVLRALLRRGGLVAKAATLATIIEFTQCGDDFRGAAAVFVVDVVALVNNAETLGELVTILAVACVAELAALPTLHKSLCAAGAPRAVVEALTAALEGARSQGGNATPIALTVPRYAVTALYLLSSSSDAKTQRAVVEAGGLGAALRVLRTNIDPGVANCEAAQEAALRFVATSLLQENNLSILRDNAAASSKDITIIRDCAVGVLSLVKSSEASVRKAAVTTISQLARAADPDHGSQSLPLSLLEDPAFLRALCPMLQHADLRTDLLGALLSLAASSPAIGVTMRAVGFVAPLEAIVTDLRNSCSCRTRALKTLFALGAFDLFQSLRLRRCSSKGDDFDHERQKLEALLEARAAQLAHFSRPAIEDSFSKDELATYVALFCEAASRRRATKERAVTQQNVLALLKACCLKAGDKVTPSKLSRRTVKAICETYDDDSSGLLEWAEFLHVLKDLREGALTGALLT